MYMCMYIYIYIYIYIYMFFIFISIYKSPQPTYVIGPTFTRKQGMPTINPQIVGFPYKKDPIRHPLISETPMNSGLLRLVFG